VALLPTEIPASREPGLRLNPQLRRIPAEIRAELTSAEIAMSGSYFDDVLRDPRCYGIENTTGKVRRPGAVRRRRDAVCTERIVGDTAQRSKSGRTPTTILRVARIATAVMSRRRPVPSAGRYGCRRANIS
jgi:hypothetical protein